MPRDAVAQLGQCLEIQAEGARLSARFYPSQRAAKAHLLLHGAAGVPQRFYAAFANWASEQGFGVLTYDYSISESPSIGHYVKAMRISPIG